MRRVDRDPRTSAPRWRLPTRGAASFGDDHVLVERYVTRPRHIEIQVFADTHGHCIHLFERDCSVQRRHQKVLEEAPAPGMSPRGEPRWERPPWQRRAPSATSGAGTVEFIAEPTDDGDLRFYFMEMNTRLQVEHPVTEAITGLDLVEWQLRVAAGEPLPLSQEQLTMRGHAIEARICAENPDANFLPATGSLKVMRWPAHAAFERSQTHARVDSGFAEGDRVSPFYDSMIAKLIVWGRNREEALARLRAALRDTHIVGLHTNVAFLRRVVASASFGGADLDTALIERERAALFDAPPLPLATAAAGVLAHALAAERRLEDADPWSRRDGWRLHGGARRRLDIEHQGQAHGVVVERTHDGSTVMEIDGCRLPLAARALDDVRHDVELDGQRMNLAVYALGETVAVFADAGSAVVAQIDPIAHAGDHAGEAGRLTAPMPGKLIALLVKVGEAVKRGQALAVMEAMKMEHTISAPRDGTVTALRYAVGDQVSEGGELLELSEGA
jgi:3-methylcrotonyl-CoA carboxylase alpha subunit